MKRKRELSVPEQHQLRIARRTLQMPDAMVGVMGGPDKRQAREIVRQLGRKNPDIHYSSGQVVKNAVVQIWDDLHNERPGYYRAFWTDGPNATSGSPVFGYASAGGSHRTISAVAREVWRYHPDEEIYRNGKRIMKKNPIQTPTDFVTGAGRNVKVRFTAQEVRMFRRIYPASGLSDRSYWFEFDARGDLVDTDVPNEQDGPGASALSEDAKRYAFDDEQPEWLR